MQIRLWFLIAEGAVPNMKKEALKIIKVKLPQKNVSKICLL